MTSTGFMLGVVARLEDIRERDIQLMREAHAGWLRCGEFYFSAEAFVSGHEQPQAFHDAKRMLRRLKDSGFEILGITPGPRQLKNQIGEPGSEEYFRNYEKVCAYFGEQFDELIDWWQIANELDIWIFREELSLEQSVRLLRTGIRGLKEAVPGKQVGINITLFPSRPFEVEGNTDKHEGIVIAEGIYGDDDSGADYAGFDSYPGTWRPGSPETWNEYLDGFHELTGKPVLIQEFGYASAGPVMSPEEAKLGGYPCKTGKWRFSWKGTHDQATQAEFLRESLHLFASKDYVLGAMYYSWRDAQTCWQCRERDCPAETAWGLLDRDGRPKLSYDAYKATAKELGCGALPS